MGILCKIEQGSPHNTEDFVKENLPRIGKLQKVTHRRDQTKAFYETVFQGEKGSVMAVSGLGSGYVGAGPRAYERVLEHAGLSKEQINKHVFENTDKQFEETVEF